MSYAEALLNIASRQLFYSAVCRKRPLQNELAFYFRRVLSPDLSRGFLIGFRGFVPGLPALADIR